MQAYNQNKDRIAAHFSSSKEGYYNPQPFQALPIDNASLNSTLFGASPVLGPGGTQPILGPSGTQPVIGPTNGKVIVGPGGMQPVPSMEEGGKILGMTLGLFLVILIIMLVFYIWAIIQLVTHWNYLETWVKVTSLILLFIPSLKIPFTPLIVLLLIKFTSTKK